jgi:hypothetical protein
MDEHGRFMSRQRALWRAKRKGKSASGLWDLEHWGDGATEDHHPGRRKFGGDTITIPKAMHPELTRRGEEEHPPLGADPDNRLEHEARLHYGWSDMHDALSDAHRWIGDAKFAAANRAQRNIDEAPIPKGLLRWIAQIASELALATKRSASEKSED